MKKRLKETGRGWLYLLPALLFLGIFMVYPLVDVLVYSFEESYNFASQSYTGVGLYNYKYVLRDPYFIQALKNPLHEFPEFVLAICYFIHFCFIDRSALMQSNRDLIHIV